jgi:hypothetical protein
MMIMPSVHTCQHATRVSKANETDHLQQKLSTPLKDAPKALSQAPKAGKKEMHTPFGENRTTFTAAECRLRVARYSTLGGRGAFAVDVGSDSVTMEGGLRCGCTIHIYVKTPRVST